MTQESFCEEMTVKCQVDIRPRSLREHLGKVPDPDRPVEEIVATTQRILAQLGAAEARLRAMLHALVVRRAGEHAASAGLPAAAASVVPRPDEPAVRAPERQPASAMASAPEHPAYNLGEDPIAADPRIAGCPPTSTATAEERRLWPPWPDMSTIRNAYELPSDYPADSVPSLPTGVPQADPSAAPAACQPIHTLSEANRSAATAPGAWEPIGFDLGQDDHPRPGEPASTAAASPVATDQPVDDVPNIGFAWE
jgi:hypothetical protein